MRTAAGLAKKHTAAFALLLAIDCGHPFRETCEERTCEPKAPPHGRCTLPFAVCVVSAVTVLCPVPSGRRHTATRRGMRCPLCALSLRPERPLGLLATPTEVQLYRIPTWETQTHRT